MTVNVATNSDIQNTLNNIKEINVMLGEKIIVQNRIESLIYKASGGMIVGFIILMVVFLAKVIF